MPEVLTHPKCGKTWVQRGNRTGHCGRCHETFEGLAVFDAHQRNLPDNTFECRPPETVIYQRAPLRLVDGTWRGPEMPKGLHDTEVAPDASEESGRIAHIKRAGAEKTPHRVRESVRPDSDERKVAI